MSKFEVFNEAHQLVRRIDQLRANDIKDENMTIIHDDNLDEGSVIYTYTGINRQRSRGTLWDRFVSKISDESSSGRVEDRLSLTEHDMDSYKNAVESGSLLLFVEGSSHDEFQAHDAQDEVYVPAETAASAETTEQPADLEEHEETSYTTDPDSKVSNKDIFVVTSGNTHYVDMSAFAAHDEKIAKDEAETEAEEVEIEVEVEQSKYHTIKDNVVNMNPDKEDAGLKYG